MAEPTPKIEDFQIQTLEQSMAVMYSWEIAEVEGAHYCRFRPDVQRTAIELPACKQLTRNYFNYENPGIYQARFEILSLAGKVLDSQQVEIVIEGIEIKTLTINLLIDDSVTKTPQIILYDKKEDAEKFVNGRPTKMIMAKGVAQATIPVSKPESPISFHFIGAGDEFYQGNSPLFHVTPQKFGEQLWVAPVTIPSIVTNIPIFHTQDHVEATLQMLSSSSADADLSNINIADEPKRPEEWMDNVNFMEIYVRGYQDSDGDGIGDIRGLISRLDYLAELGITGLWLMPIMESSDNDHGYAVKNYRDIEPDYGSLADFDELLKQAHQRGIRVIIDYLINHSSDAHPVFTESALNRESPYRDWYIWQDKKPKNWEIFGHDPWRYRNGAWYYGPFSDAMPDFNLRNPKVIEFHINNLRFWLNRGVDGFRFDAVGMLTENGADSWEDQSENHRILNRMLRTIQAYTGRFAICESPSGFEKYANENSCDRAFNFKAHEAILETAKTGKVSEEFDRQLRAGYVDKTAFILANHDGFAGSRVWNQLDGDEQTYRLAAATYLLTSATPFTYYGEEIGMATGRNLTGDHALRTPMSWSANEQTGGFSSSETVFRNTSNNVLSHNVEDSLQNPDSLYHYYKKIYQLRKSQPAIAGGYLRVLSQAQDSHLLISRSQANNRIIIVINYATEAKDLVIETGLGDVEFQLIFADTLVKVENPSSNQSGVLRFSAPGRATLVLSANF